MKKIFHILFFGIFTQNYWRKLSQTNLRMSVLITLAWVFCGLEVFFILNKNIINTNPSTHTLALGIEIGVFGLLMGICNFIWLKYKWKGEEYYGLFQKDLQRYWQKNPQSNQYFEGNLPQKGFYSLKIIKKILKNYTFFANIQLFHLQILAILSAFLFVILEKEYKRITTPKAETITQSLKKKIQNTKNLLSNIAQQQTEIHKKLQNTHVNLKMLEKTLKNSQKSFQEQQGAIWQNYGFLGNINQTQQKLNAVISIPEKENVIKDNPLIFTQVRGLVEVELDLAEKNTAQASEMLATEGNILSKFQKFASYQQNCQYKAQKGIQLDQKRIKELENLIIQQKNISNYLKNQQKEDSIKAIEYQEDIKILEKKINHVAK